MREIKFRAFNQRNDEMLCNDDLFLAGYDDHGLLWDILQDPEGFGKGYILMQFTGLRDKNGNKIYEGDIVKKENSNYIDKIIFMDGCFRPYFARHESLWEISDMCCVVGNIYENPELLKKQGE